MDWEKVKRDFEKWRKWFLAKKPKVNDKRRDLEPTGNEPPPDVYKAPDSFGKALEEQLRMQNIAYTYKYLRSPEETREMSEGYSTLRGQKIDEDDISDIKIYLENSEDVNDFIREM